MGSEIGIEERPQPITRIGQKKFNAARAMSDGVNRSPKLSDFCKCNLRSKMYIRTIARNG